MRRKKLLGALSLVLLVFAFMICVTTESGYCIGDNFLRALGLKAWSLESPQHLTKGFHYTFLFFIGFAVIGYTGAKHFLKEFYPKLVNKLPVIVIILILTSSQLFAWGYGVALSFSKGVNAVDYKPAQSNCNYASNPGSDLIAYTYQIRLKNYSDNMVKFYMQVQMPRNDYDFMLDVTEKNAQGKEILEEFILEPREEKQYGFVLEKRDAGNSSVTGSMYRPNIIIFNKDGSREFIVH